MRFTPLQKLTAADLFDLQRLTEPWEPFNPIWTTGGTLPVLGNGTLTGRKLASGKTRWNLIQFTPGSTTTFGTGQYFWSISETARTQCVVGSMYIFDNGAANRSALAVLASTLDAIFGVTSADTDVSATVPQTWVNGDLMSTLIQFEVP